MVLGFSFILIAILLLLDISEHILHLLLDGIRVKFRCLNYVW